MHQLPPFDVLRDLAVNDPEALESLRKEAIEVTINSAPVARQQRLRGLQWVIDNKLSKCSCPTARLVMIQQMMWESFGKLRDRLQEVVKL